MVRIVYKNGYPFFEINGECVDVCMFRSFRPTPANVSLFSRAGVRVHQILVSGEMNGMDIPYSLYGGVWVDEDEYNFAALDRQLAMFKKYAPDDYYMIFIQLDAPEQWLNKHPDAVSSFYALQSEGHDERWKKAASKYLRAMISYCEETYGDCICGYGITAGRSCEWFSGNDFSSRWIQEAYEQCYTEPYTPPAMNRAQTGESSFRDADSAEYKLLRLCEKNTVDTALYFAKEAQKVLKHEKPLGLFGGYYALKDNTLLTNQFERVWDSPDIDMVWAPAMYDDFRQLENASGYTAAVNSIQHCGKLHVNELDHRTDMAYYPCEHGVAKVKMGYRLNEGNLMDDCYETEYESIMVLRRELAATMQRGSAFWWFDFYGGYYASPAYEKMLKEHIAICKRIYRTETERESVAELAVFVDTPSMTYVRDGLDLHEALTYNNVREIAKCGAPYDIYRLSDMKSVDMTRYKAAIFLNPIGVREEIRMAIREMDSKVQRIWVYGAGLLTDGTCRIENLSDLVGMKVNFHDSKEKHTGAYREHRFGFETAMNPSFYIEDDDAEVLGRYEGEEAVCCGKKGNNIYFASGNISSAVWREVARACGVHIYAEMDGALYANNHFICFETTNTEQITLKLKEDSVYEELFDGGSYHSKGKELIYSAPKGTTKLFLKK